MVSRSQTLGERESGTARLEEAVAAYRAALEERTRARVPLEWAMTQMNLGIALRTLGERESGTARLEEAVAAYRAALEENTRARVPLQWARTQMRPRHSQTPAGRATGRRWKKTLARACRSNGPDAETSASRSRHSASARAARRGWRRRSRPIGRRWKNALARACRSQWAMTQMNLGIALRTLGERESGTARLEEAVAAYPGGAGRKHSRARAAPMGQDADRTLASRSQTLGTRESGTARLEEAVAAYRAALEENTRARVPLEWAMTQQNLGNALRTLGTRESGTARLEEAVAAYRAALEERTRARVPLQWALTQTNLGHALRALGERESGTARLEEAVAAFRAALEENTRARVPLAMGPDAAEPRHRAPDTRRARERHGAAGGGGYGLPGGAGGMHP